MGGDVLSAPSASPSPDVRPSRRLSIIVVLGFALIAAPVLLGVAGLTAAGYVLPIGSYETPVDALVVLGGFGVPRAELAARIFAARPTPLVIVTGAGDCEAMQETLVANGVPLGAIEIDCKARSTFENAAATAKMLQGRSIPCATLVTHWFHARRAIATFRAAMPETRFFAVLVEPDATPAWRLGWTSEPKAVLLEYFKIVWYAVAHGVPVSHVSQRRSEACA